MLQAPCEDIVARVPATVTPVTPVTPIDAATCRLRSGSVSLDLIAMHLALLGGDVSITAPSELVAAIGARLVRAAGSLGDQEGAVPFTARRSAP